MYAKNLKLATVIITYNRVDEAKAQMDIVRELWQPMFKKIDLYHEFNGEKNWYPKKYREDFLHRHRPMSHFIGANHMLNQGFKHVLESGKKYDYIIATSADVWFYDPKRLKKILLSCKKKKYQLATSFWGMVILATEFFIITPDLARKVFPLRFSKVISRYKLLSIIHSKIAIFEAFFTLHVLRALKNPNKIYLIPGRRTVLPTNRFWSPDFYASHHNRNQRKKDILSKIRRIIENKTENMPSLYKFLS